MLTYLNESITGGTLGKRLPVAGGKFLIVLSCSATFTLRFYRNGAQVGPDFTGARASYKRKFAEPITEVQVITSSTQTIELVVADDEHDLAVLAGNVTVQPATGITSTADYAVTASAAIAVAANSSRKLLTVRLVAEGASASDGSVRIGDSAITATRGIELSPGDSAEWPSTAALYAIRGSASVANLSIVEHS